MISAFVNLKAEAKCRSNTVQHQSKLEDKPMSEAKGSPKDGKNAEASKRLWALLQKEEDAEFIVLDTKNALRKQTNVKS